jgi:hypothetical protein
VRGRPLSDRVAPAAGVRSAAAVDVVLL